MQARRGAIKGQEDYGSMQRLSPTDDSPLTLSLTINLTIILTINLILTLTLTLMQLEVNRPEVKAPDTRLLVYNNRVNI